MMKKTISLILAAAMILSMAACGGQGAAASSAAQQASAPSSGEAAPSAALEAPAPAAAQSSAAEPSSAPAEREPRVLVVYFSSANTASADVVSGATPRADGLGSTAYLAQLIHDEVGGDLVEITPETDYPVEYNATTDVAKREQDDNARPAFQPLGVNPEDYDVIFVGYPVWWYTLPMLLYTFFDTYDFSGKTIVPFNTHEGSRDGGTYREIAAFEPNAAVLDGLAVNGRSVGADTADAVKTWLDGLAL